MKSEKEDRILSGLVRKTHNPFRLKPIYYHRLKRGYYFIYQEFWSTDVINFWGRAVRTTNERKQNSSHCVEYGEQIVRGARRKLPSAWEDIPSGFWDKRKSWKHNSKRARQYK